MRHAPALVVMAAVAVIVAVVVLITGCTGPAQWQDKGYPSEEACWRAFGWTDDQGFGQQVTNRYDLWCG